MNVLSLFYLVFKEISMCQLSILLDFFILTKADYNIIIDFSGIYMSIISDILCFLLLLVAKMNILYGVYIILISHGNLFYYVCNNSLCFI